MSFTEIRWSRTNFFKKFGAGLFLGTIILLMSAGCSPERKLAKSFVFDSTPRSVLVIKPQYLYKSNLKEEMLDSLEVNGESMSDSLELINTKLIQLIDDSLFIANYMIGIQNELKKFGIKVFTESRTNEFMEIDSNAYIVNVAQIEIEEAFYVQRDDMSIYDTYYYHDHLLNAIYVNSWIEISEINAAENHNVYFANDAIADELMGEFTFDYFSSEVKYLYETDTLKHTDLYNFAFTLGRTYAGYTFDLLLNNYLKESIPESRLSGNYWRYNPVLENLFYAEDDRFIPLGK